MTRRAVSILFLAALLVLAAPAVSGDRDAAKPACPFSGAASDSVAGCPFQGGKDIADVASGCPFGGDRDAKDAAGNGPHEDGSDVVRGCPFGGATPRAEDAAGCPYRSGASDRIDPERERNKV